MSTDLSVFSIENDVQARKIRLTKKEKDVAQYHLNNLKVLRNTLQALDNDYLIADIDIFYRNNH